MAGGRGTRFWPLGRESLPKQFVHTPLGILAVRAVQLATLVSPSWKVLIQPYMHEMARTFFSPHNLLEVAHANTAELVYAALRSVEDEDEPAVFLPSDHYIHPPEEFARILLQGVEAMRTADEVTLIGITPSTPETRFGYILPDLSETPWRVERFVEKPPREEAEKLIQQGALWNAGVFILTKRIARRITTHEHLLKLLEGKAQGGVEPGSFDKLVLEKTSARVIPFTGVWNDVGTWTGLLEVLRLGLEPVTHGRATVQASEHGLFFFQSRQGFVHDHPRSILVETPDAILLSPLHAAERAAKTVPDAWREAEPRIRVTRSVEERVLETHPRVTLLTAQEEAQVTLPAGSSILISGEAVFEGLTLQPGESLTREESFTLILRKDARLAHVEHLPHARLREDAWFTRAPPFTPPPPGVLRLATLFTPREALAPASRHDYPPELVLTPDEKPLLSTVLSLFPSAHILTHPTWMSQAQALVRGTRDVFVARTLFPPLPVKEMDVVTLVHGGLFASAPHLLQRDVERLEAMAQEHGSALLVTPLGFAWPVPLILAREGKAYAFLEEPSLRLRATLVHEGYRFTGILALRGDVLKRVEGFPLERFIREAQPRVLVHTGRAFPIDSWNAYAEAFARAERGNVRIEGRGMVYAFDAFVQGVEWDDTLLVITPDLLFASRLDTLSTMQGWLDEMSQRDAWIVPKPWGWYRVLAHCEGCALKLLRVHAGEALSLQKHAERDETWIILEGKGVMRVDAREFTVQPGMSVHIPREAWHRVSAEEDLLIFEVQTGNPREADIVRGEDVYARHLLKESFKLLHYPREGEPRRLA